MKCKCIQIAVRFIPVKPWQAFLIRRHIDNCAQCQSELMPRDALLEQAVLVTPQTVTLPDNLWTSIQQGILEARQEKIVASRHTHRPRTWAWSAIAATAVVIMMVLITPGILHKHIDVNPNDNAKQVMVQNHNIVIHSIKTQNRPAQAFYFQAGDSNRVIVWVK